MADPRLSDKIRGMLEREDEEEEEFSVSDPRWHKINQGTKMLAYCQMMTDLAITTGLDVKQEEIDIIKEIVKSELLKDESSAVNMMHVMANLHANLDSNPLLNPNRMVQNLLNMISHAAKEGRVQVLNVDDLPSGLGKKVGEA